MFNFQRFRLCLWFSLLALPAVSVNKADAAIDSEVLIQPIQVCDDFGTYCANTNFFTQETDKIWAQAGIDITFLRLEEFDATEFLDIQDDTAYISLISDPGHGQSSDPRTVNMWFVDSLYPADFPFVTFGQARLNANDTVISRATFDYNNGIGRVDTIAHELGHNLGLDHTDFGAGGSVNLMTAGSDRFIASSIDDIAPDGAYLEQLTRDQINVARNSIFVHPMPDLTFTNEGSVATDNLSFTLSDKNLLQQRRVSVPERTPSFLIWLGLGAVGFFQTKFKSE